MITPGVLKHSHTVSEDKPQKLQYLCRIKQKDSHSKIYDRPEPGELLICSLTNTNSQVKTMKWGKTFTPSTVALMQGIRDWI